MPTRPTIDDYRTMIEAAPEGIIVYTPEKFLYLNKFAAEKLGFDQASLVGESVMQFVHPESVPAVIDRIHGPSAATLAGVPLDVRSWRETERSSSPKSSRCRSLSRGRPRFSD